MPSLWASGSIVRERNSLSRAVCFVECFQITADGPERMTDILATCLCNQIRVHVEYMALHAHPSVPSDRGEAVLIYCTCTGTCSPLKLPCIIHCLDGPTKSAGFVFLNQTEMISDGKRTCIGEIHDCAFQVPTYTLFLRSVIQPRITSVHINIQCSLNRFHWPWTSSQKVNIPSSCNSVSHDILACGHEAHHMSRI